MIYLLSVIFSHLLEEKHLRQWWILTYVRFFGSIKDDFDDMVEEFREGKKNVIYFHLITMIFSEKP